MTASENVILTSLEGKKLETQELFWDKNKNKIYTEKISSKDIKLKLILRK